MGRSGSRGELPFHVFEKRAYNTRSIGYQTALAGISNDLIAKGLKTRITLFGYFLEFRIHGRG